MSWCGETSLAMKYISNGACEFLINPISLKEMKNIWQHVFRQKMDGNNKNHKVIPNLKYSNIGNYHKRANHCVEYINECEDVIDNVRDLKKSRLQWTKQLHQQFVEVVCIIGIDSKVFNFLNY